jgi:uncharacterized protein (TIGR00255 family)
VRGMTAFGRAKVSNGRYEVVLDIVSVNKRHLEINLRMPFGYQEAEAMLRRELFQKVMRGQITLTVSIRPIAAEITAAAINWPWVEGQMEALSKICSKYGCQNPHERACFELWKQEECFCKESIELTSEIETLLKDGLSKAFTQFDSKRRAEGQFLALDLRTRGEVLKEALCLITESTKGHVERIKDHLQELLTQYVPTLSSEDRVLREIVLYADKSDVSEEIARIRHHMDHFSEVLQQEESCGKLLEFILQELLREFNTLGAKTSLTNVSTAVVLAKTELEKMREQVQNVE